MLSCHCNRCHYDRYGLYRPLRALALKNKRTTANHPSDAVANSEFYPVLVGLRVLICIMRKAGADEVSTASGVSGLVVRLNYLSAALSVGPIYL